MPTAYASLQHAIALQSSFQSLISYFLPAAKPALRRAVAAAPAGDGEFQLVEHVGADRAKVEQFIRRRFAESFGARVDAFMPRLFSVQDARGEICGAFGLRSATGRLFLEQYLDRAIEREIGAHSMGTVERRQVVEVGHFSGTFPGAVRAMIALLTERLHGEGFKWVAFTGTTSLRNAFSRMGLHPLDIDAADVARLPAESRAAWGSYYANGPRVLVGNIGEGYRALGRARGASAEGLVREGASA